VLDAATVGAGGWYVLVSPNAGIGPQFLRVLRADSVGGPFAEAYGSTAGGFAEQPQLAPSTDPNLPTLAAGLRATRYTEDNRWVGEDLVVIDMTNGDTVRIHTSTPVQSVQWGR
jgi:hypothetical protein